MIPLKKFSEYEAETWDAGSRHSDETRHTGYSSPGRRSRSRSRPPPGSRPESPHSYHQASHAGDYYRDTNLTFNNSSNPGLRLPNKPSIGSNLSHHSTGGMPLQQQYTGTGRPSMSNYGGPMPPQLGSLPFLPFGPGGPGSHAGSDFGGGDLMGAMGVAGAPGGFAAAPSMSMYGMPMAAPRNTVMTNLNMFSGGGPGTNGSQSAYMGAGGGGSGMSMGMAPPMALGMQQRPVSTFSLATTVNPFAAGPSTNTDPSDEELINALRLYLSTQDLMTVTKKTTREAIMARFPKADLSPRKEFLNQSIDKILSES